MPEGWRAFLVMVLVIAAAGSLILGLTLPVVKFTHLYFWTDTHSLASIIAALYRAGELFLAGVIVLFSIVFPVFKLVYIAAAGTLANSPAARRNRLLQRISWLGKWSMLDVLVLALLIFYAKSTALADAVALPGIYFFAASVALTMIAYGLIESDGGSEMNRA
jgi:paraquat-inducible protein A